jgi:two-component system, OmpR family, sensor kinase
VSDTRFHMPRAAVPIAAALLGLAGSLATTFALHRAASAALDRVLEERLRGAGESAALLLGDAAQGEARLRALMEANRLEGAYLVSPSLVVLADATGPAGDPADLLRVDAGRVEAALRGEVTIGPGYAVGDVHVETAYFPVRGSDGRPRAVLALEAGEAFSAARGRLRRALGIGVALSGLTALALALAASGWARSERQRREAAARAARGDALARMAAAVAHEIRNPLGIIRAAVELLRERAGDALGPRDREGLEDVLGEVARLRRLTQDFLDLSAEPALKRERVELAGLAAEAARGSAALHPDLAVTVAVAPGLPPVEADPARLRQVLANLLANAAEAGARRVEIRGEAAGAEVRLVIRDDGPGIDPAIRDRLFEAFASAREGGTGLGLAVSRRLVERHGGSLGVAGGGPGTTFELRLPRAA